MKIKLITLIISASLFLLLNLSCDTKSKQPDSSLEFGKEIVTFEPNSKCYEYPNLDSLGLKLGNVNNLDIYNGIKYFRFGDSLNLYNDCIECNSKGNRIDTCKIKSKDFMFLDKMWEGELYFFESKLAAIYVFREEQSLTETYNYLETIFSSNNEVKVSRPDLVEKEHHVVNKKKHKSVIYSENLKSIYSCFLNKEKDEKGTGQILNYIYNEQESIGRVFNSSFRTITKYYPMVHFQFTWKSKKGIILNYQIVRYLEFDNLMGQSESGITMSRSYNSHIFLVANKKMIRTLEEEDIRRTNRIDSLEKAKELEEKEKLLKKF